jgi:hypothetical protein
VKPVQIDLPGGARDVTGNALHVEAYRLGECTIYLSREDWADAREAERDFRWRLTIGHPQRPPTMEEISEARKLLPADVTVAIPFPHRAYWLERPAHAIDLVEVKDTNLIEQLEFEGVNRRNDGACEVWVDDPPEKAVG